MLILKGVSAYYSIHRHVEIEHKICYGYCHSGMYFDKNHVEPGKLQYHIVSIGIDYAAQKCNLSNRSTGSDSQ